MDDDGNYKRLRDDNRKQYERKKRKSDTGEQMAARNQKRKCQENPLISGSIRFYVKSTEERVAIYNKMDKIKLCLAERISSVTNEQLLNSVFDFFIQMHGLEENDNQQELLDFQSYLPCKNVDEDLFLTSYSAMRNICAGIQQHRQGCENPLDVKRLQRFGHTGKVTFTCKKNHIVTADSSQHLPGGMFLANLRMIHAWNATGLRYSQYKRFCDSANFGLIPEGMFENQHELYCLKTEELTRESIAEAINEEVATEVLRFPIQRNQ